MEASGDPSVGGRSGLGSGVQVAGSVLLALLVLPPANVALAQTSESRKIADGTEPAWSPDGQWILISVLTGEQRDLFMVRPDGSERRQITDTPGSELLATWSAGGRVAFVSPTDHGLRLFVLDHPLQGDVPPHHLDLPGFAPAFTSAPWSPDGTTLTVVMGEYPELDIYRVPLHGSSPTSLVTAPGYDGSPAWSRDGRLAFVSDRGGSRDIWVRHPDGTLQQVTPGTARDDSPAWSPDGRWIAFVSDRTGNREIHVVPSEGGSVTQITENEAWCNYPTWSPDGSALAYALVTRGRGNDQVMIVSVPEQVTGRRMGGRERKPNVAILVYDGVQVMDHAIPFEVFGQFSLNNVYTVSKDSGPLTTYMGMRILPNYSFADAPPPDVLVLPGGNATAARNDPAIIAWVERTAATADHVLTICTGVFFLVGNEILNGSRVTTWYDRQDDVRRVAPGTDVIGDELVVESGKLVSAAGLGIEGALRVLAKLHGTPWAEVVRLNMEYEPLPDSLHVPRVGLADLKLPNRIYAAFPWRQAELRRYEGSTSEWAMAWRYDRSVPLDSLRTDFLAALSGEEGWRLADEALDGTNWTSDWCIYENGAEDWRGAMTLVAGGGQVEVQVRVWSAVEPCFGASTGALPGAAPPAAGESCPPTTAATALRGIASCLEEVSFASDSLLLAGQWLTPRGGGPFPAAVVIRGSGESVRGNPWTEMLAAVLVETGVGVLVPDKRGSGESEGDWRMADFVDLAGDAIAAVGYLSSRPDVMPDRIGVMGLSQGGQIAPIAAERSDSVAFVINIVGAAVPFLENVRFEMLHTFEEEGLTGVELDAAMNIVDAAVAYLSGSLSWDAYAGALRETRAVLDDAITDEYFIHAPDHWRWEFFRRLADFDPADWWLRVKQPALVMLGEADRNTPTAETASRLRQIFAEIGHPDATVLVFEGLGHDLINHSAPGPMGEHGLRADVRNALGSWVRRVVSR